MADELPVDRELGLLRKIERLLIERERLSWGLRRILAARDAAPARTSNDYDAGYNAGIDYACLIAEEALESAGLMERAEGPKP